MNTVMIYVGSFIAGLLLGAFITKELVFYGFKQHLDELKEACRGK